MSPRGAAKVCIFLVTIALLSGCQGNDIPVTSTVVVEVSTETYLPTDTPVPDCVALPDVHLEVKVLSENSTQIKVTGLQPKEAIYTIFSSEAEDKSQTRIECCPGETADQDGIYESSMVLRAKNKPTGFKNWKVQVIHSRGAACAEFVLP